MVGEIKPTAGLVGTQPRVREGRRLRDRAGRAAAGPRDQRRQGHRPPRDHPHERRAPAGQALRRRPAGLRPGRAALPGGLPSRRRVREHAAGDAGGRARVPHLGARAGRGRLARRLRRGVAGRPRARRTTTTTRCRSSCPKLERGEDVADRVGGGRGEGHQAAAALLRRVAAGRDGDGGQAGRRRRAARGDEGLRDRHAGHAGGDHRAAHRRRLHRARGALAGVHREGRLDHQAARRARADVAVA